MLEHGGRLRVAALQWAIPVDDWLDLSAALNPASYPVGDIPSIAWQRLPEDDDALPAIATRYYGTSQLLAVAGSQAAIQLLPRLFDRELRVAMLQPSYNEHAHAWQKAGHHLFTVSADSIDAQLDSIDVLLLVNPNNPTGDCFTTAQLLHWHQRLASRGGYLIVDEAFIDATPQHSLCAHAGSAGLIVLRSLGKFFGLAGARVGFVFAPDDVLHALREQLGPWPIAHPSRIAAQRALLDTAWQQQQRDLLPQQAARLALLLAEHGLPPSGGCALFQWIQTPHAAAIHQQLASQGILTRLYNEPASLRFGLPGSLADWQRLEAALAMLPPR